MGFFTKKQVKLSAVAFNLNDFEELNYNQLVEVNGGCGGGFWAGVRNFFSGGCNSRTRNNGETLNGTTKGFIDKMTGLAGGYYVYGGNDPNTDGGLDCSGSVLYGLNQEGNNIPDQTANDIMNNKNIATPIDASDVQRGDLRFLVDGNGNAYHVQVIIGEDGSRFNATGGPENDINNPGALDILMTKLPQSGVYRRPNFAN